MSSQNSYSTPRTDALLKTLEEGNYNVFEALPRIQEFARQLERDLVAANERVEPESKPEWIACADRFPGSYETVLLTDSDGIRSTGFWNGTRWTIDLCEGSSDPHIVPSHWMPLPSSPATGNPGK